MTTIRRTRAADPTRYAKTIAMPDETILTGRGHVETSTARGPSARIIGVDGNVRLIVVSQRDSALGFDD